jgi:uncharacterized protein (DUF1778 family)
MSAAAVPASSRFEFRLRPDAKNRIERAAALVHETASDFARTATEERADHVLRDHDLITPVTDEFFEDLLAALDEPPAANPALRSAAKRARTVYKRR